MLTGIKILFKVGCGILAACLLLELSLHIIALSPAGKVFPVIEPQLGEPNEDIGYAYKPDQTVLWTRENRARVHINALGLRDNETTAQKPQGTYRIALSGDSEVEALQVENHYTFENIAENISSH